MVSRFSVLLVPLAFVCILADRDYFIPIIDKLLLAPELQESVDSFVRQFGFLALDNVGGDSIIANNADPQNPADFLWNNYYLIRERLFAADGPAQNKHAEGLLFSAYDVMIRAHEGYVPNYVRVFSLKVPCYDSCAGVFANHQQGGVRELAYSESYNNDGFYKTWRSINSIVMNGWAVYYIGRNSIKNAEGDNTGVFEEYESFQQVVVRQLLKTSFCMHCEDRAVTIKRIIMQCLWVLPDELFSSLPYWRKNIFDVMFPLEEGNAAARSNPDKTYSSQTAFELNAWFHAGLRATASRTLEPPDAQLAYAYQKAGLDFTWVKCLQGQPPFCLPGPTVDNNNNAALLHAAVPRHELPANEEPMHLAGSAAVGQFADRHHERERSPSPPGKGKNKRIKREVE